MLDFIGSLYGNDSRDVLPVMPRGFRRVTVTEEIFLWWKDSDTRLLQVGGTKAKPHYEVITPVGVTNA